MEKDNRSVKNKEENKEIKNNIKGKSNLDNHKGSSKKGKNESESLIFELKTKLKDIEDKLLRSLAENDNLRKRHEKEIEDSSKYAIKNLSYSLLPAVDNFQRALNSIPGNEKKDDSVVKNLVIGIKAIEKELLDALEKNGVTIFESLNQKFDPELHQAVSKVNSEKEEGIIVEEMQKGFKIDQRLLRPAMVVVSMGPKKEGKVG
ncbi:MAG: nucleotide exchange factor GrpE [Alphaproteobacteria bacterium]